MTNEKNWVQLFRFEGPSSHKYVKHYLFFVLRLVGWLSQSRASSCSYKTFPNKAFIARIRKRLGIVKG